MGLPLGSSTMPCGTPREIVRISAVRAELVLQEQEDGTAAERLREMSHAKVEVAGQSFPSQVINAVATV
jgi:hypothetical protein